MSLRVIDGIGPRVSRPYISPPMGEANSLAGICGENARCLQVDAYW